MKCDRCDNEAIFEIHFIDHEKKRTISLCKDCYFKYIGELMPKLNNSGGEQNIFQTMISDLVNSITENIIGHNNMYNDKGEKKCSNCGSTISEILENEKFGCSQCYEDFKDEASDILKKIEEKVNSKEESYEENEGIFKLQIEIDKKKEELKQFIDSEEYEKAANIRDEINILKENIENINGNV